MKRLWVALLAAGMVIGVFAMPSASAGVLVPWGDVFTAGGAVGDATTENSFASATYYKCDDPAEPAKVEADIVDADTVNAASYGIDTNWGLLDGLTVPVMAVLETVAGQNGWAGVNYTTSFFANLDDDNNPAPLLGSGNIEAYPVLNPPLTGTDWINITWTATPPANFLQYDVYRTPAFPGETLLGPAVNIGGNNYAYNDTGIAAGSYYYFIGITYQCASHTHATTGRSGPVLATTFVDTVPPEVSPALLNGAAAQSYGLSAVPTLSLTATVDDAPTGGSTIGGANYTTGLANWLSSLPMNPADGAFNTMTEGVIATVPNPAAVGAWDYCVYGWDVVPNYNTTSTQCASLTITDDVDPAVLSITLQPNPIVSGSQVWVNATLDDTGRGDNFIFNASYEVVGQFGSTPMSAVDATWNDNIVEPVTANFATTGWLDGIYDVCVYGADNQGNVNTTAACVPLSVSPDGMPPVVSMVMLDGVANPTIALSALPGTMTLTANVDDSAYGGSNILNATWTVDGVFSGTDMNAVNAPFDSPTEDVTMDITPPSAAGVSIYCVYGWDVWFNSGSSCTTLTITDDVAPLITSVTLNQLPSLTIVENTPQVYLNATLDDMTTGGSNINNASFDPDWGPGGAMVFSNPPGDQPTEDFEAILVTAALAPATYQVCVYGADISSNIAGPSCATLTVVPIGTQDNQPPEIYAASISPDPVAISALPPSVTLTATLDDTNTGGTAIGSANYTTPAGNFPGTAMTPVDGAFNGLNESVTATVSTPSVAGGYEYCVYGTDSWSPPNANLTGACTTLQVNDDVAPSIRNVALSATSIQASSPPGFIAVTATLDDSSNGNSDIANASFTVDGGPSTALTATTGFDSPLEDVTGTFDPAALTAGGHDICVYGADSWTPPNIGGPSCVTLTVVDDVDPVAVISVSPDPARVDETVTLNGTGSSDAHGTIQSWAWTILDSQNGVVATPTGETVTTSFAAPDTYTINLVVMDDSGNTGSASTTLVVSSAVVVPNPPTNLQVTTGTAQGTLQLTWTASTTAGVGYNVYRATSQGGAYAQVNTDGPVSGTAFTDDGLSDDTTYWYKVTAVDSSGNESDFSTAASGTTKAAQPEGIPSWLWILLILLIVVVLIVIIWAATRRKPAEYAPVLEEEAAPVEEEPVAVEEEAFMCPRCGATVTADASECPSCGALFEADEEAAEAPEEEAVEEYAEDEEE